MNFFAEIFDEYIDALNRAGFVEHLLLVLAFSFFIGGLMLLLIAAVVWFIWCLHDWWYGLGDSAAVEKLIVPAAAGAVVSRVGGARLAQVNGLHRRTVCS